MPSPFVAQQAGYLALRQSKQGVLLAQPYLMLQAACFREQGLERCCSRTAFASASESRNAAFLPAIQERDQVTEGLAHGQHLNHPQGLLPGLGSHHALLGTAACPGSPGHPVQRSSRTHSCRAARDGGGGQEGLILSLVCSFSLQATSILIASADIPGEESKVLACFRQPLHPGCLLPPGPALVAGREAGRRISEQPQCLSCSAFTHTWQHTSSFVSSRHRVLPCLAGGTDAPSNTQGTE